MTCVSLLTLELPSLNAIWSLSCNSHGETYQKNSNKTFPPNHTVIIKGRNRNNIPTNVGIYYANKERLDCDCTSSLLSRDTDWARYALGEILTGQDSN